MNFDDQSLGSVPLAISAVGLLLLATFGLGSHFLKPFTGRGWQAIDSRLVAISVGVNLLALLGLLVGSLTALSAVRPIWILLILIAGFSAHACWINPRQISSSLRSLLPFRFCVKTSPGQNRHRAVAQTKGLSPAASPSFRLSFSPFRFAACLLALITLGPALCPPTGWDELVYHHELPRRWLAAGWPAFYSDLPYSGFPSLGEILFWLLAPIEHVIAPRLVVWTCWIIGLAMVYRLLRRTLRPALTMALLFVFASSSTLLMISANCYVESIQLMNVAGLLLILQRSSCASPQAASGEFASWRIAAILGILAGGAASVKLTGLPILVLPLLWYLIQWRQSRLPAPQLLRSLSIYALTATCFAFPFYIRPWVLTGNPFYPYYSHWFSSDAAQIEMSRYHHALGSSFGVHGLAGFFFGPIFLASDRQLYDGDFGWQFPILLALFVFAGLANPRRRRGIATFFSLAAATCLYLFWFLTAQQARFLIPAILLATVAASRGIRCLDPRWRQPTAVGLVVVAAVSAPWRTAGHYLGSWMCVLGLIAPADYIHESTDREYLPLIAAIGERTPPDAKLLLLFEHRGFYIPRPHQIGTPFFQERGFTPPEQFADAQSILALLVREKITHLVIATKPTGPDMPSAWLDRLNPFLAALNDCIREKKLLPIWQSERYILCEIRSSTLHDEVAQASELDGNLDAGEEAGLRQ